MTEEEYERYQEQRVKILHQWRDGLMTDEECLRLLDEVSITFDIVDVV